MYIFVTKVIKIILYQLDCKTCNNSGCSTPFV